MFPTSVSLCLCGEIRFCVFAVELNVTDMKHFRSRAVAQRRRIRQTHGETIENTGVFAPRRLKQPAIEIVQNKLKKS
jgi:hypothetical protein